MNNPYIGLLNIMQEEGRRNMPSLICLGSVVMQNPLTVKVCDLILDEDELLVADGADNLKFRDNVVIIQISNKQKYIILCKVVNL